MEILKELPLIQGKRYLIFGDIHGRYDQMIRCLEQANYDASNDIIMTVGDMIDRGTDNIKVLNAFIDNEDFHAIMGNHEDMVINNEYYNIWLYNGGDMTLWELEYYNMDFPSLQDMIRTNFPYVIYVGDPKDISDTGSFRLVHGEFTLVPDDVLYSSLKASQAGSKLVEHCIWSRSVIEQRFNTNERVHNTRILTTTQTMPTFSGHTPIGSVPYRIGCRYYIDTGMKRLTLIDAHTKEWWQA